MKKKKVKKMSLEELAAKADWEGGWVNLVDGYSTPESLAKEYEIPDELYDILEEIHLACNKLSNFLDKNPIEVIEEDY